MDQSNLTIGGIGGDPSGSHPIGNLNAYWTPSVDDMSIKYTANGAMTDPGAIDPDATVEIYSEELCVGPILPGTKFVIGDTGNAQATAAWQFYKPSHSNNFNSGNEVVPGTAASQDGGTWTNVSGFAQDFSDIIISGQNNTAEDELLNGVTRLRVALKFVDAGGGSGGDGITAGIVDAAVAAANAAHIFYPIDKQAQNNDTINSPITIGGIGADPS